jgi:radical SAM protein with 4Fe4S-binding SPASM domain
MAEINEYLSNLHGERFRKYRELWDQASQGKIILEKPLYFFAEITNYCNLKCKMCYLNLTEEKKPAENMPMERVHYLAEQCKDLAIPSMILSCGSECLLHPNIKEVIQIFKKSGIIDFYLITNGQKLSEDISETLIDLQIEMLQISLDAATEETYKKIRGGSLRKVEENIHKFLELKKRKKSVLPFLRISFVKMQENRAETDMFFNKWKDLVDIVDYQEYVDFSEVDNLKHHDKKPFICPDPFQRIGVSLHGNIYPCCSFYKKHFKLGNIREMTLLEAWNSQPMKDLRQSFVDGKLAEACKKCYENIEYGL